MHVSDKTIRRRFRLCIHWRGLVPQGKPHDPCALGIQGYTPFPSEYESCQGKDNPRLPCSSYEPQPVVKIDPETGELVLASSIPAEY